jgi:hypothetical protein
LLREIQYKDLYQGSTGFRNDAALKGQCSGLSSTIGTEVSVHANPAFLAGPTNLVAARLGLIMQPRGQHCEGLTAMIAAMRLWHCNGITDQADGNSAKVLLGSLS